MVPSSDWWPAAAAGAGVSIVAGLLFAWRLSRRASAVGRFWLIRALTEVVWFTACFISIFLNTSATEPKFCIPLGAINHFGSVAVILWSCAIAAYFRMEGTRVEKVNVQSHPSLPGVSSPPPASRSKEALIHLAVWLGALAIVVPFFILDIVQGGYYVITEDRTCYLSESFGVVRFLTQSLLAVIAVLFMITVYCVTAKKMPIASEDDEAEKKKLVWRAARYVLVFSFCWLPAVVLDVLLLAYGHTYSEVPSDLSWVVKWRTSVFYLQGLLNCLLQWYHLTGCKCGRRPRDLDDDRSPILPKGAGGDDMADGRWNPHLSSYRTYGSPEHLTRDSPASPDNSRDSVASGFAIREEHLAGVLAPRIEERYLRPPRASPPIRIAGSRTPSPESERYQMPPAPKLVGSLQSHAADSSVQSYQSRPIGATGSYNTRTSSFGYGMESGIPRRMKAMDHHTIDAPPRGRRGRVHRQRHGSDSSLGEPPSGSEVERQSPNPPQVKGRYSRLP